MQSIFYDKTNLLSYNAFISIVIGARGVGKTFCFKKWAIEDTKGATVWVRRYQIDIDDLKSKFLPDLIAERVIKPDDVIAFKDDALYINDILRVRFIALNTSMRKKSASYSDCNKIVFDEFLERDRSKYLKNEISTFYELIETVGRLRTAELGQKEIRVIMLANKTSFVNPYFADWHILPFSERFKAFKDGLIVVDNYRNKEFEELKKKTAFGRLIQGTDYGNYAIENQAWADDDALIAPRPKSASCYCIMRCNDTYMGIWESDSGVWVSEKYDPSCRYRYGLRFELRNGELPLRSNCNPMKWLINSYDGGMLFFEDQICKQMMFTLMQNVGRTKRFHFVIRFV